LQVDPGNLNELLHWLQRSGAKPLYAPRLVSSTYFDTRDLLMFIDTVEGSTPRRKVRIRCYGNHGLNCSSDHFLETKETNEQGRRKASKSCPNWRSLEVSGLVDSQYGLCTTAVHVTYRRSYFGVHGVRMTVDQDLSYASLRGSGVSNQEFNDLALAVEVKAPAHDSVDRLTNAFPFPVTKFSKYERAVAGLFPRFIV